MISEYLSIVEKKVDFGLKLETYHSILVKDYTSALVKTIDGYYALVKQFRPSIEGYTIELVAGTVEKGESPRANIVKEIAEEVGMRCRDENVFDLGISLPDTGRHENNIYSFYVENAEYIDKNKFVAEEGIEIILVDKEELFEMIDTGKLNHSLHLAVILLAITKGYLTKD